MNNHKNDYKNILRWKYVLDVASSSGNINVLDWWLKYCKETGNTIHLVGIYDWRTTLYPTHSAWSIICASQHGHVNVLDWWLNYYKETNMEFLYFESAVDHASNNGHVSVLDWWLKYCKETGTELKYSKTIIRNSSLKDVKIRNWWKEYHQNILVNRQK